MSNDLSINIKSKIYEIRGKQVMLSSDIAILYNVETKVLNQTIKRNINRFPEEFCFRLTKNEYDSLRSKIVTLNKTTDLRGKHVKYLPYVLTEQGVMMLSGLLKSDIAVEVNIKIVNAFVEMRKYISNNLFDVSKALTNLDDRVKVLEDAFIKGDGTGIYYEGSIYDAYSAIIDIFKKAKKSLIIIDNYVDKDTLDIIAKLNNIKIFIITSKDTSYIKNIDIDKYNKEYSNLNIFYNKSFHDRFFIIDKKDLYHCGASINRIGVKTFAINKIIDEGINKTFIDNINNIINDNSKEFIP